jgi:hypothetical protein
MPRAIVRLAWPALLALGLACSKSKDTGAPATTGAPGAPAPAGAAAPAAHVQGTPQTDQVLDAFKDAGLHADGFAVLQPVPYGASFCQGGRVESVDTLICEYGDDGALDRGKQLLRDEWNREGVQTGVTTAAKRTLLAVADRGHHDPNGKTINKILAAFKKL